MQTERDKTMVQPRRRKRGGKAKKKEIHVLGIHVFNSMDSTTVQSVYHSVLVILIDAQCGLINMLTSSPWGVDKTFLQARTA